MEPKHSNQLIHESSPYLLQHSHNPVNWYPWGKEALEKAKEEGKVILVSIGYSACHWCHVMERESFEDETTAAIMNKHFINIKIDREERPDIDHIYMDAVQAMTGSGGWPLNVFLTPDTKPFYGGTYFPPVKAFNRSSWKEVLYGIAESWKERKTEIEAQAENLLNHLQQSNSFGREKQNIFPEPAQMLFDTAQCHTMFENIMKTADTGWGGFGKAPKFPQTFTIQYLLQYHHFTGNQTALQQALLSLDKMIAGGIYDQAGGGFSRYSTDTEWLAPHFEKMLYDNALLLSVLCDAYSVTQKKEYEKTIRQTFAFLERELKHKEGGFNAALDADSEGEEGKFYVWQKSEIEKILKEDGEIFCKYFDVHEEGNWEEKNILRKLVPADDFCRKNNLNVIDFENKMDDCLQQLLLNRNKRIRPGTDDKILLGWNALLVTAFCKAGAVLNDEGYKNSARETFAFLLKRFRSEEYGFYHTYKNGTAKYPAFLDDHAYMIQCCIHLQQISSDQQYLEYARKWMQYLLENFADSESPFLFYTGKNQDDVVIRKKEIHDGATPSGNSITAENLIYLGIIFNEIKWVEKGQKVMAEISTAIVRYPGSFAVWAVNILKQVVHWNEVAIIGKGFENYRNSLLRNFIPNLILQCSNAENPSYPLLAEKKQQTHVQLYLCKNYSCLSPVDNTESLVEIIRKGDKI
ncbi:MAG: thioredoxin domain-containing protein [Ferruginibacter sp.]